MDERELTDAEWDEEIKEAIVEFRRALWTEKRRDRTARGANPWVL
jgi:hypothetical protein